MSDATKSERVSDRRWCFYKKPGDGEGYGVVAHDSIEPDVSKWVEIAVTLYDSEARRICEAHNGYMMEPRP